MSRVTVLLNSAFGATTPIMSVLHYPGEEQLQGDKTELDLKRKMTEAREQC